ncbi:MAG: roadblock/LC7 domain-containing protein [Candidatus Edwardsbacteria bacterium]
MARTLEQLISDLSQTEGVKASIAVLKEDGTLLKVSEKTEVGLGEITAFLGSAAEVITSTLEIGNFSSAVTEGDGYKMLILPHENAYVGIELEEQTPPWWLNAPNVTELLIEEKVEEVSELEGLMRQKVLLVNLLVEEFATAPENVPEGFLSKEQWQALVESELASLDPQGKIRVHLEMKEGQLTFVSKGMPGLTKQEVFDTFEKLVNLVCKKGIAVFGFVEVKQKFQAVITRLAQQRI